MWGPRPEGTGGAVAAGFAVLTPDEAGIVYMQIGIVRAYSAGAQFFFFLLPCRLFLAQLFKQVCFFWGAQARDHPHT